MAQANVKIPRRHTRIKTDLPAQAKPARRQMIEARMLQLGEGGAFLTTAERIPIGSDLVISVTIEVNHRNKSCIVQGHVVWANWDVVKGWIGVGVAFDNPPPPMTRLLREYIALHLSGAAV